MWPMRSLLEWESLELFCGVFFSNMAINYCNSLVDLCLGMKKTFVANEIGSNWCLELFLRAALVNYYYSSIACGLHVATCKRHANLLRSF
jgi:hypothetical protein